MPATKTKTSKNGKARRRTPRSKRDKAAFLPGMEPPSYPALDHAADIYVEARDERVARSKDEKAAKVNLIESMIEHGVERYETPDGLVVSVTANREVKVEKKKEPKTRNDREAELVDAAED